MLYSLWPNLSKIWASRLNFCTSEFCEHILAISKLTNQGVGGIAQAKFVDYLLNERKDKTGADWVAKEWTGPIKGRLFLFRSWIVLYWDLFAWQVQAVIMKIKLVNHFSVWLSMRWLAIGWHHYLLRRISLEDLIELSKKLRFLVGSCPGWEAAFSDVIRVQCICQVFWSRCACEHALLLAKLAFTWKSMMVE